MTAAQEAPVDDFTTLTDDELARVRSAVLAECERRDRLAAIPAQVQQMAATFLSDGGDRAALAAML